jgi:hypothetical protein
MKLAVPIVLLSAIAFVSTPRPVEARTYKSNETSFAAFARQAKPGDMYVYEPGWYHDPDYLIHAVGLQGTKAQPITIYAPERLTFLDGEGAREPIHLEDCRWIRVGGLNACNSNVSVVHLNGSSDCWIKEVCAWNGGPDNSNAFAVHDGTFNRLEDCAGWGQARKTFSCSQGGDDSYLYRCWGRWERSTRMGPKKTYTWAYNSYRCRFSYCLATWDARMPDHYVLHEGGKPYKGVATPRPGSEVDQPHGFFAVDPVKGPIGVQLDHCVGYLFPDQCCHGLVAGFYGTKADGMRLSDCISFMPGRDFRPFQLGQHQGICKDVYAHNLTGFGTVDSFVGPTWQGSGVNGQADVQDILKHWRESPMLVRIKALAGEDVMARLEFIAQSVGRPGRR